MLRTGVDLIEVRRVRETCERYGERFLNRVFCESEWRAYEGRWPELAARFAAKEAVSKALGTGIGDVTWTEFEIVRDERGMPGVRLSGRAAAIAAELGLREWSLSLSHTAEHAIAFVVAMG